MDRGGKGSTHCKKRLSLPLPGGKENISGRFITRKTPRSEACVTGYPGLPRVLALERTGRGSWLIFQSKMQRRSRLFLYRTRPLRSTRKMKKKRRHASIRWWVTTLLLRHSSRSAGGKTVNTVHSISLIAPDVTPARVPCVIHAYIRRPPSLCITIASQFQSAKRDPIFVTRYKYNRQSQLALLGLFDVRYPSTKTCFSSGQILRSKGNLGRAIWPRTNLPDTCLDSVSGLDWRSKPHSKEFQRPGVTSTNGRHHSPSGEPKCRQPVQNHSPKSSCLPDPGI